MRISDWSSDVCSSDLSGTLTACPSPAACSDRSAVRFAEQCVGQIWKLRPGSLAWIWERLKRTLGGNAAIKRVRSEERRVGKECVVRVELGGRRIIKKEIMLKLKYSTNHTENKK